MRDIGWREVLPILEMHVTSPEISNTPDNTQVLRMKTLEECVPKHAELFWGIGILFLSNSAAKQWQALFVSSINR